MTGGSGPGPGTGGGRLSPLPIFAPSPTATRITAALFVLAAAVSWAAAGYDLGELRTALAVADGESLERAEVEAHATAGTLVTIAQALGALLVALGFLPWLHQMRVNVRALGVRRLRYPREWTYLGVLVPGLNLVRPFQVVAEIWRASDPAALDPLGWKERPLSPLVPLWWGLCLAWIGAEIASAALLELASGLERIQLAHGLALAGDVCAALAASAGFFLVVGLQRAQLAKHRAGAGRDGG